MKSVPVLPMKTIHNSERKVDSSEDGKARLKMSNSGSMSDPNRMVRHKDNK